MIFVRVSFINMCVTAVMRHILEKVKDITEQDYQNILVDPRELVVIWQGPLTQPSGIIRIMKTTQCRRKISQFWTLQGTASTC